MKTVTQLALFLLLTAVLPAKGWFFSPSKCRQCNNVQLPQNGQCYFKRAMFTGLSKYPDCADELGVEFYLFSESETKYQIRANDDTITQSAFDYNKPTKFIIHGFTDEGPKTWSLQMKEALLGVTDMNVIIVNWKEGAKGPNYPQAVANTISVADMIARLIQVMRTDHNVDLNDVHLIGHSLGAHVAGLAGKKVYKLERAHVGRITGLDPAGLYFESYGDENRLIKTDAEFVDVIHATSKILGTSLNSGRVDFFPNQGQPQPDCVEINLGSLASKIVQGQISELNADIACSHARVLDFFTDSITECAHPDNKCVMGYHANPTRCQGVIELVTSQQSPYCQT